MPRDLAHRMAQRFVGRLRRIDLCGAASRMAPPARLSGIAISIRGQSWRMKRLCIGAVDGALPAGWTEVSITGRSAHAGPPPRCTFARRERAAYVRHRPSRVRAPSRARHGAASAGHPSAASTFYPNLVNVVAIRASSPSTAQSPRSGGCGEARAANFPIFRRLARAGTVALSTRSRPGSNQSRFQSRWCPLVDATALELIFSPAAGWPPRRPLCANVMGGLCRRPALVFVPSAAG